ncbi:MAG: DUF47 family protein [Clostridia bacterium]|nr:DUF47 family protein [Clostridia bacterium]MBQ8369184.1 DUF47 family protein [Clostridia bacterium]
MAKGDKFYFDNFVACAELSKKAASYLVSCLENYDPKSIEVMLVEMHKIEHNADMKKHEMNEALAKAFVTPVDREDLDMLSQNLDQVTDELEEVMQKFYIYNIPSVIPSMVEFAKNLVRSCELLCDLMAEFENFKRSKKIRDYIIKLNDVEEECDRLYLKSMRELNTNPADVLTTISLREIFECLEACADACEHVSECVGSVIMKNT